MTEAELQDARRLFVQHCDAAGAGNVAVAGLAVMDYVDFLHKLLHDLREESTAYARGVEDGRQSVIILLHDHPEVWAAWKRALGV